MTHAVKLYTFNGSNPSLTVELMLAHRASSTGARTCSSGRTRSPCSRAALTR